MNNLYWFCPVCQTVVLPVDVTYEETHDLRNGGCGASVECRWRDNPVDARWAGDHVWPLEFPEERDYTEPGMTDIRMAVGPPMEPGIITSECLHCDYQGPVGVGAINHTIDFDCPFCLDAFEREDAPWKYAVAMGDIDPGAPAYLESMQPKNDMRPPYDWTDFR